MRGSKREKTILLQPNNLGKTGVFVEGGKGAKVFKKISIGRVVGGGGGICICRGKGRVGRY